MSLIPLHPAHAFTYCLPRSSGSKSVTSLWSAVRRSSPVYCSFCTYILECRYSAALLSCTNFTTSITCIPVLHVKCSGSNSETSLCPLFKYSSSVYCSVFTFLDVITLDICIHVMNVSTSFTCTSVIAQPSLSRDVLITLFDVDLFGIAILLWQHFYSYILRCIHSVEIQSFLELYYSHHRYSGTAPQRNLGRGVTTLRSKDITFSNVDTLRKVTHVVHLDRCGGNSPWAVQPADRLAIRTDYSAYILECKYIIHTLILGVSSTNRCVPECTSASYLKFRDLDSGWRSTTLKTVTILLLSHSFTCCT